MILIPLRNDLPDYSFQIELDGKTYGLRLRLNQRDGSWYFDVRDAEDTVLVAGRRLVIGLPLLRRYTDERLPPGELLAVDSSGANEEAGPADLGARVRLFYRPRTEG